MTEMNYLLATQKAIAEIRHNAYRLQEYNVTLANKIEAKMGEVLRLVSVRLESLNPAANLAINDRVAIERQFVARRKRPKVDYSTPTFAEDELREDGVALPSFAATARN